MYLYLSLSISISIGDHLQRAPEVSRLYRAAGDVRAYVSKNPLELHTTKRSRIPAQPHGAAHLASLK